MKNIEISERVEEACEEYKLYSADCDCVVFVNDFKINGKENASYGLSGDGEFSGDDCFILAAGEGIHIRREVAVGIYIFFSASVVNTGRNDDVDFLVKKIKDVTEERAICTQRLNNYRTNNNTILSAYDYMSMSWSDRFRYLIRHAARRVRRMIRK